MNNDVAVLKDTIEALDRARSRLAAQLVYAERTAREPSGDHQKPSEYLLWVATLQKGDAVRVCSPWDDGWTPGGHISRGVVRDRRMFGVYVRYKRRVGSNADEFFRFNNGASGPYAYLVPVDRDVYYHPERGMVFAPKKRRAR